MRKWAECFSGEAAEADLGKQMSAPLLPQLPLCTSALPVHQPKRLVPLATCSVGSQNRGRAVLTSVLLQGKGNRCRIEGSAPSSLRPHPPYFKSHRQAGLA